MPLTGPAQAAVPSFSDPTVPELPEVERPGEATTSSSNVHDVPEAAPAAGPVVVVPSVNTVMIGRAVAVSLRIGSIDPPLVAAGRRSADRAAPT